MKKWAIAAIAAAAGYVVVRKLHADRAEQDLWTEATSDTTLDLR